MIEKGANLNIQNKNGNTPLNLAIFNSKNIAILLIEKGANLDIQDYRGNTPLHDAIAYELEDISRLLIEKGADFTFKNKDGITSFGYASKRNHEKALEKFGIRKKRSLHPYKK